MKLVAFLAAVGLAVYWFGFRPACGRSGAIACPNPALEQGVGETLNAKDVCRGAGYLCNHDIPFQVLRWPLDKGKLRVKVELPDFVNGDKAKQIQAAAVEGIRQWDRRPFPLVIETGITFRWDIAVVWSEGGMSGGMSGVAHPQWEINGKRVAYSVGGLGVVVPPLDSMPAADLLARVKATAAHEMGHSLGIMWHSEREADIMFPTLNNAPGGPSERDYQTLDALYALPNGARVQ